MALISTRTHAVGDYAGGAAMILAAGLPFVRDRRAAALLRMAGMGTLAASAFTDYELGVWRRLPMPMHLALDAATGALLTGSALMLRRAGARAGSWLPGMAIGAGEIALAAVTERRPSDVAADDGGAGSAPSGATGISGEGLAAREPGARAPVAPPPVETPGPSVTAPQQPESDVERAERVDENLPAGASGDLLVAQQEAAAAAEAAAIGGARVSETGDPAMDPVYEAGGGEQEGFEAAEAALIENATHGDAGGNPLADAIAPEVESDRSGAVYGEADEIPSTEVVEDPSTSGEDPGEGPGLAADRGESPPPR